VEPIRVWLYSLIYVIFYGQDSRQNDMLICEVIFPLDKGDNMISLAEIELRRGGASSFSLSGPQELESRYAPAQLSEIFDGKAHFVTPDQTVYDSTVIAPSFVRSSPTHYYRSNNAYLVYYNNSYVDPVTGVETIGVGMARTYDGFNFFDKQVIFMPFAGQSYDSFPSVWYHENTFYMATEYAIPNTRAVIALRTSSNGLNWSAPTVILSENNSSQYGGWETGSVGTPTLWRDNGQWYLYYHGARVGNNTNSDTPFSIGVAISQSLYSISNGRQYGSTPINQLGRD
jgi:hypothetical protein